MRLLAIILLPFLLFSCNNTPTIKVDPNKTIDSSKLNKGNNIIKIGVAAMLSPEETLPVYNQIVKYIGEKLNSKCQMVFSKDYQTMNNKIREKEVLIGFVCSGAYVKAHDHWGMELIAAPMHNGETYYYSDIIVNKHSKFKSLLDLEGKKFAFTDPESNTGTIAPKYQLAKLNRNEDNFFSKYIYSGSHDNSIDAVAMNVVDGAAVDNLIYEYLSNNQDTKTKQTVVIDQIGPFCTPPVVCNPNLDSRVKQKLRDILLSMNKDSEGEKILKKLCIDKFVLVQDTCYNSIREMKKWVEKQK